MADETIPQLFARQASALGAKPLFLIKRQGTYQSITWQHAYADVLAFGAFLLQQQLGIGDRVVILSESRPEWGITDVAVQSVGAWTVPIYPTLQVPDLRTICADAQPAICIASSLEQVRKLIEVSGSVPSIRLIVALDPMSEPQTIVKTWDAALAAGREEQRGAQEVLVYRSRQFTPHDVATVIYTSGTTGEPKGVMLSHHNFLSNAEACRRLMPVEPSDVYLSFLPLSHVFERMAGWYLMLAVGATIAYAESMDTIPQNMLEVKPTVMLGVPRFFEKLQARIQEHMRQAPGFARWLAAWALRVGQRAMPYRLSGRRIPEGLALQQELARALVLGKLQARLGGRLRFFVSGGAPLAKEIGEFFYAIGVTILEGYGLTETSPVIAVNRLERPRFGSVGQPIPGVEVSIAEDGEILTKGPHVMLGYYRKPEATAAVMVDGWFHTGDIGHVDGEGYLHITDRKKDLIKTAGGKFVSPQKLEKLFLGDPCVSQVFVFGDQRPYCVALVVPNFERIEQYAQTQGIAGANSAALVQDERIRQFVWNAIQARQQALASFEQVKKIALLGQEFSQASGELTPTLKTKRKLIAQRYSVQLDQLYQS